MESNRADSTLPFRNGKRCNLSFRPAVLSLTARNQSRIKNKKMKSKLFITTLVCGLALAGVPSIKAQDTVPPAATDTVAKKHEGKKHGDKAPGAKHMEEMTKELNLTADQQAKISEIRKEAAPQMKAIRDDATLDKKAKHEKMKPIVEANNTKIRALLTAEQAAKFDELQAKRKAEHAKHN